MNAQRPQATLMFKNDQFNTPWKGTIAWITIAVILFVAFGVLGQLFISWPKRSKEDKEVFERNVEFWIGNHGVVFSMLLFILLISAISVLIVVIKEAGEWKKIIETRFLKLQSNVIDTISEINITAKSITALSENMRIELIPDLRKNLEKQTGNVMSTLASSAKEFIGSALSKGA
jgi:amino acid transporter